MPSPSRAQPLLPADAIAIVVEHRQLGIAAARAIPAGSAILLVDGDVVARPSRYSVQIGVDRHVDAHGDGARIVSPNLHAWQFLDHSCAPDAVLRDRVLVALRPIAPGERITFDYEANEWHMSEPFVCRCGAERCRGLIRGYRHLSPSQRQALAPIAAEHLLIAALRAGWRTGEPTTMMPADR